jgi:hypothetical protein
MARFTRRDGRPYRLALGPSGPHRFGGKPVHRGVTPSGTQVPLHLLLLLDVSDPACPFTCDASVKYLPLYYPLKYGLGGPAVQYSVVSGSQIEILYMSDPIPDAPEEQYVQVSELPSSPARIIPLCYEEARIISFSGGYFRPNDDDGRILEELARDHPLVQVGGYRRLPVNAGDVICHNPQCELFSQRVWVTVIASIPPVPVNGSDAFWHEYQGGDVEFYFCLCHDCATVIAFNVAG